MWGPQAQALAPAFHVVAMDLPGHGQLRDLPFTLESSVDRVSEVLRTVCTEKTIIIGLSLGGYTAIAHSRAQPERVAGLVLSGCSVTYRSVLRLFARWTAFGMRFYSQARFERSLGRRLKKQFPEAMVNDLLATGIRAGAAREALLAVAAEDFHAMVRAYRGPVMILNGEYDTLNRRAEDAMAASALSARIEVIGGAGHLCSMEQPERFTAAVRAFTESIS